MLFHLTKLLTSVLSIRCNVSICCNGPVIATFLALGLSSSLVHAQLSVLSEGNKPAQWKASQVATLKQQLAEPKLASELKLELQSQLKWLTAWEPGQLSDTPLWETEPQKKPWDEPSLDPNGLAGELRQRLLGPEARPTAKDTAELKALLTAHDNDLGVRQLHLHWLDQDQYRKVYPQEIANAAAKVLALIDGVADPDQETLRAQLFTLYRRGRALIYRELPEVLADKPMGEAELVKNGAELVGVFRQLKKLVEEPRPEFVLLEDRMLRRDHWNGRALALLEDFGGQVAPHWFLKKRRDILRDLGWEIPAKEASEIYAKAFPIELAEE
ncbi:MAG: hypothetical protein KDA72_02790 [Planctomycetales bacterium]|nr:hypothetical protein [Planctomycetales bacterium]